MSGNGINAVLLLIGLIFDFYIFVLFLRLILAWEHADYHHPLTQFVVQLTSFIVKPLKKILPDIKGIEISTLVIMLLVEVIKYFLVTLLSFGFPNIFGLLILALSDLMRVILQATIIFLIVQFIFNLIQPNISSYFIYKITAPLLRPIQKLVPPIYKMDISPIIVSIVLALIIIVFINPLTALGLSIAVGA